MLVKVKDLWRESIGATVFHLTAARSYVAYGLTVSIGEGIARCDIEDDFGNLVSVPLSAFEIEDGAVDPEWVLRKHDSYLRLWPMAFHERFFFDDFSEGEASAVAAFAAMKRKIGSRG